MRLRRGEKISWLVLISSPPGTLSLSIVVRTMKNNATQQALTAHYEANKATVEGGDLEAKYKMMFESFAILLPAGLELDEDARNALMGANLMDPKHMTHEGLAGMERYVQDTSKHASVRSVISHFLGTYWPMQGQPMRARYWAGAASILKKNDGTEPDFSEIPSIGEEDKSHQQIEFGGGVIMQHGPSDEFRTTPEQKAAKERGEKWTSREIGETCQVCLVEAEPGTKFKKCGRCKSLMAKYCSVECQRRAWPGHKQLCVPFDTAKPKDEEEAEEKKKE